MSSSGEALMRGIGAADPWCARARYFNPRQAFALELSPVPSASFVSERDRAFDPAEPTGLIAMDLSPALNTPYPATTPLALSRYARIRGGDSLTVQVRASVHVMCMLAGRGRSTVAGETMPWKAGDVMVLPGTGAIEHDADEDAVAWLVTDEPALAFLGVASVPGVLEPVHYRAEELASELEAIYDHPDVERFPGYAVVLSSAAMEHTRNIHPVFTLALNTLPAGRSQRPHVHSAMALTLCLQGNGVHSMVNGERKDWSRHVVMVTPPGAVHSHHNEGTERMRSFVIQDGGLHYHARTTGFAFAD